MDEHKGIPPDRLGMVDGKIETGHDEPPDELTDEQQTIKKVLLTDGPEELHLRVPDDYSTLIIEYDGEEVYFTPLELVTMNMEVTEESKTFEEDLKRFISVSYSLGKIVTREKEPEEVMETMLENYDVEDFSIGADE